MTIDTLPTATRRPFDGHPTAIRRATDTEPTNLRQSTRAHDRTIEGTPVPPLDVDDSDSEIIDDDTIHRPRAERPYTEEELKGLLGVGFIRTPYNERVVFRNIEHLGSNKILNRKFGYSYAAYLWLVEFLSVGMTDFKEPLKGILQITCRRWGHACLPDPETAFCGICAVVANKQRQIVQIETNLGDRS